MVSIINKTEFVGNNFIGVFLELGIALIADVFYEALDAAAGHKALFGNLVNADVLDLSEMSNQIPGNNKIRIILVIVIENEQKR